MYIFEEVVRFTSVWAGATKKHNTCIYVQCIYAYLFVYIRYVCII